MSTKLPLWVPRCKLPHADLDSCLFAQFLNPQGNAMLVFGDDKEGNFYALVLRDDVIHRLIPLGVIKGLYQSQYYADFDILFIKTDNAIIGIAGLLRGLSLHVIQHNEDTRVVFIRQGVVSACRSEEHYTSSRLLMWSVTDFASSFVPWQAYDLKFERVPKCTWLRLVDAGIEYTTENKYGREKTVLFDHDGKTKPVEITRDKKQAYRVSNTEIPRLTRYYDWQTATGLVNLSGSAKFDSCYIAESGSVMLSRTPPASLVVFKPWNPLTAILDTRNGCLQKRPLWEPRLMVILLRYAGWSSRFPTSVSRMERSD